MYYCWSFAECGIRDGKDVDRSRRTASRIYCVAGSVLGPPLEVRCVWRVAARSHSWRNHQLIFFLSDLMTPLWSLLPVWSITPHFPLLHLKHIAAFATYSVFILEQRRLEESVWKKQWGSSSPSEAAFRMERCLSGRAARPARILTLGRQPVSPL